MKSIIISLVALTAIALVLPAGAAENHALKGTELSSQTQIKLADARSTALKARPGAVVDQELEKESGGSGLRYSFDIKSHGKVYEVGVDAKTGAVLENAAEGKNAD